MVVAEAWLERRIELEQDVVDAICRDCEDDWSKRTERSGPSNCREDAMPENERRIA
jgi:hypothetical protein